MPALPLPEGLARDGIALRRMRARDAGPWVAAFREDPQLAVNVGAEEDLTEAGCAASSPGSRGLRAHGQYLGLTVTDATGRPFLGHVMLHSVAFRHRRGEVGYWLVPAARGRGVGRAAVGLLVDWAFEALALDRIEITTTPDNAAARALAASLGFSRRAS